MPRNNRQEQTSEEQVYIRFLLKETTARRIPDWSLQEVLNRLRQMIYQLFRQDYLFTFNVSSHRDAVALR